MTSPKSSIRYCAETGAALEYRGYGRPPKYAPEVAARRRKESARQNAKNQRAKFREYLKATQAQTQAAA